jgi:hypothetical protein
VRLRSAKKRLFLWLGFQHALRRWKVRGDAPDAVKGVASFAFLEKIPFRYSGLTTPGAPPSRTFNMTRVEIAAGFRCSMAKSLFNKGQRVFVKPVGAWSTVDRILPQWVKGVEEPLKVFYDVGLGRDFQAHELAAEGQNSRTMVVEHTLSEDWRLARVRNRWQGETESTRSGQPHPGSFPVVVTDERDWGGWRVPAAEYDRSPERIEFQARIITNALKMLRMTRDLAQFCTEYDTAMPEALRDLSSTADEILSSVYETEAAEETPAPLAHARD